MFGVKKWSDAIMRLTGASFCTIILWLTFSNQLTLFISSQYVIFAAITSTVGLVILVSSFIVKPNEHSHDEDKPGILSTVFTVTAVGLLLLIAPTSLSNQYANTKPINSNSSALSIGEVNAKQWESFTVKEWSVLSSNPASFDFTNKTVNLVGYITYLDNDSFYLSRLVVHCCAIDAQPVGVKVVIPDWTTKYKEGDWVDITGNFEDLNSTNQYSLVPVRVSVVEEPEQPYVS